MDPPPSRVLTLPVVPNARHLGGLPTSDGGLTPFHNVIRCGTLAGLNPAGIDALQRTDIRTIVDLRTADERSLSPEPELRHLGIAQRWMPLVERDPAPYGVHLEHGHAGYLWMYQHFLERGRKSIVALLQVLAEADGGLLYHCSAGMDRTGIVTAVLLSLHGVPDSAIVEDHALSVTTESLAARNITGPAATQRITAPQDAMSATLDLLRARWGGAAGYLADRTIRLTPPGD